MTTFKMPGLSRYKFTYNGECYSKFNQITLQKGNSLFYALYDNENTRVIVTHKEVIQYGKHIKELNTINMLKALGLPLVLVEPIERDWKPIIPLKKRLQTL